MRSRLPLLAALLGAALLGCSGDPTASADGEGSASDGARAEGSEAAGAGAEGRAQAGAGADPYEDLLDGRPLPETAHPQTLLEMRLEEAQEPSAVDGQGEATVEPDAPVGAGSSGSWTITYTAGPAGIAAGGAVVLQVSPFWFWSDPQPIAPDYPGYTTVELAGATAPAGSEAPGAASSGTPGAASAGGADAGAAPSDGAGAGAPDSDASDADTTASPAPRLVPELCGTGCLRIAVADAPLPAGARLRIHYGSEGTGAAQVDRLAERGEEFFLRVDGDGDGVTAPLADPPALDIVPGPAKRLHVVARSTAAVGEPVWLNVAALDAHWNRASGFTGAVEIVEAKGLEGLPERIEIRPEDRGARRVRGRAAEPGVARVIVRVPDWGSTYRSNPVDVLEPEPDGAPRARRVYWADLHGHSALSDGTGQPDQYFAYARDVAALDVSSLTDHDHWGLRYLDREPELFERIRAAARRFHDPGRFVTLLGYEWTSWIFGHRHVLYFGDEEKGRVFGFVDRDSDEPEELWAKLERLGLPAITVPHHPAGGPVAIDWSVPPHPRFEPVVEIASVHGTSECIDCPAAIYEPVEGAFVRDALDRGYRLGLVGSGDTHDGHPGLGSPDDWTPGRSLGLAGILAESLDRASVLEALRARRVYATSGPRIVLRFAVSGTPMGGVHPTDDPSEPRVAYARALATAPIERLDIVKNGEVAFSREGAGAEEIELLAEDPAPAAPGDYYYARVVQTDGGLAWSSPVWVEAGEGE